MKLQRASRPRHSMQGLSLVELMIALALGLIVLAALVSVFANTSASRAELERTSRQIENGRFAMELLGDELRHAGFYGEANVKAIPVPGVMPDPCSTDVLEWRAAMPIHLQAHDDGITPSLMPCFVGSRKLGTDVLVVRRAATCEAGITDCPAPVAGEYYVQVAKCGTETPITPFMFGTFGTTTFNLTERNCATPARVRRYIVRIYFVSTDNGAGQSVPTLKRLDLSGTTGWVETPLVEGIEELNLEYGIDTDNDGAPDVYTADPFSYVCAGCTPMSNWGNVVATRVNLLARSLETSPNYTDGKTYTLGRTFAGGQLQVAPGDGFRRHAYVGLVRIVNASERRDTP